MLQILFCLVTLASEALSLAAWSSDHKARPSNDVKEITGFNWTQIQPSPSLRWHACYESFECARLQVPLDWNDASNSRTAAIAVIRLPAVVPRDDPTFGKSILLNPGGPGGSGVDQLVWDGHKIRDTIVDSPDKHFEIIGFDPRGVHYTTPSVSCFGNDWLRQVWLYRNWAAGQLGSSDYCFNFKWAAYESLAALCEAQNVDQLDDGVNMHQFVSTALTARDMLAIVDSLQAESSKSERGNGGQVSINPEQEPDLLQYWGFSYGTFLGNTFASMFPNRVGKLILDGNVDPYDYAATGWLKNLFDSNKNLHWFYYSCFHAGKKCVLFDSNTRSLFDIQAKVLSLFKRLQDNPIAITHDGAADIVTYYDVTNLFHGAAYAPLFFWPDVAEAVKGLLEGNGTAIIKYLKDLKVPQPDPTNPKPPSDLGTFMLDNDTLPYPPDYVGGLEGAISVLCGDGEPLNSLSKHDWELRLAELNNQSMVAAPFWLTIPFACHSWPSALRPAEHNRFVGPFASKLADYDSKGSPILFIGSTADPVTPLRNAISNSRNHEGSRVLTQDSPGHCSGPVNPSRCTFEVIRQYFRNGTLPEEGKVCVIDRSPWDESQLG